MVLQPSKRKVQPIEPVVSGEDSFLPFSSFTSSAVERVENRIYFYAPVSRENVLRLNKEIHLADSENISEAMKHSDEFLRPIWLYINSEGGSFFDALSSMDAILLAKCPVYTVVDGAVASGATLMSIVGKKRFIKENSFMLIHHISSEMWGKYDEFIQEMKNLEKFSSTLISIYQKYAKIPKGTLEEILSKDIYFNAKECLKYQLVDEVLK